MQARQEAGRAAAQPIAIAQGVAALAALIAIVVCVVLLAPWLVASIASSRAFLSPGLGTISTIWQGWVLGAVIAVVVATSLAVYLAMVED